MKLRIISLVALLAFVNYLFGCTTAVKVPKERLASPKEIIVDVVLPTGELVKFDRNGGRFNPQKRLITGLTPEGKNIELNVDDILYARVKKTDVALSILATVGVIAGVILVVFLIALATKDSCPFVYAYDGENYVFDAEPYGGAICSGLKKTDYSRLEHLKPANGKYHLLLRNEVKETQYTDELKLLVVDHDAETEFMPDVKGNLHSIINPTVASLALDENGKDLMNFIKARDEIAWQSRLPIDDSYKGQDLRHHLTFAFPKPAEAETAKLLVNAGTALWGSNMIGAMLQLRGNKLDAWYESVNRGGPELFHLMQFIEREELYVLKLYVKEGQSWVQRGYISGGGPFITEDRVIPLDLSGVVGDTLVIRLNPPRGFWTVDYLGMEYDAHSFSEVQEVVVASSEDQHGKDVTDLLRATDNRYQVLHDVGDWAKVSFDAPPQREGATRTVFLETTGYYEIHLDKGQPEQTELIHQLLTTPGLIVEYAVQEYLKWRASKLSMN